MPTQSTAVGMLPTNEPSPDDDIQKLVELNRRYRWATGETRRTLERAGVVLARSDFYTDTPTLDEIDGSFEYAGDRVAFGDGDIFDIAAMERLVEELLPFAVEF